jgi:hypothetical protein
MSVEEVDVGSIANFLWRELLRQVLLNCGAILFIIYGFIIFSYFHYR